MCLSSLLSAVDLFGAFGGEEFDWLVLVILVLHQPLLCVVFLLIFLPMLWWHNHKTCILVTTMRADR